MGHSRLRHAIRQHQRQGIIHGVDRAKRHPANKADRESGDSAGNDAVHALYPSGCREAIHRLMPLTSYFGGSMATTNAPDDLKLSQSRSDIGPGTLSVVAGNTSRTRDGIRKIVLNSVTVSEAHSHIHAD
jgi:hypothetical protein